MAWGAVGWGLGALTSGWGYGSGYYNPYYSSGVASTPYDYSQPVVVNNYNDPNAVAATDPNAPAPTEVAQSPADQQSLAVFDDGLAKFKAGDYQGALDQFNVALKDRPTDPVVHEVRALALFALGDYQQAGAALNSLLSSAPGMDWTTMSGLYGNPDDYTAQLRKLEAYCGEHRDDAAAYFVLAYQYLVLGSKDTAIKALEVVVKNQPKDVTAKRMLDALVPADATPGSAVAATSPPPTPPPAPTPSGTAAAAAPQTDLVGTWRATAAGTVIDLTVTADSQFTWKAAQAGKPPLQLQGQLTATSDELDLASKDQGNMSGSVKSQGPNKWQFVLAGAGQRSRAELHPREELVVAPLRRGASVLGRHGALGCRCLALAARLAVTFLTACLVCLTAAPPPGLNKLERPRRDRTARSPSIDRRRRPPQQEGFQACGARSTCSLSSRRVWRCRWPPLPTARIWHGPAWRIKLAWRINRPHSACPRAT